jgi:cation transport ATPase
LCLGKVELVCEDNLRSRRQRFRISLQFRVDPVKVTDRVGATIDAGDIVLMRGDLRTAAQAIALARRTMRTMQQNLFWAFVYNVIGIPVAAGVLYPAFGLMLSPILASAAMAFSSVSVVSNSLRLRRFATTRPS